MATKASSSRCVNHGKGKLTNSSSTQQSEAPMDPTELSSTYDQIQFYDAHVPESMHLEVWYANLVVEKKVKWRSFQGNPIFNIFDQK